MAIHILGLRQSRLAETVTVVIFGDISVQPLHSSVGRFLNSSGSHYMREAAMVFKPNMNEMHRLVHAGVDHVSGPYRCYIGHYDTTCDGPWPRVYTFPGCNFIGVNDRPCGRSLESGADECEHKPFTNDLVTYFYRFRVLLFDASGYSPPLQLLIFDEAAKLLGMSAKEFQALDPDQQRNQLDISTFGAPMVNVWVKTDQVLPPIISSLEILHAIEPQDPRELHRLPRGFSFNGEEAAARARTAGVPQVLSTRSTDHCRARRPVRLTADDAEELHRVMNRAKTIISRMEFNIRVISWLDL